MSSNILSWISDSLALILSWISDITMSALEFVMPILDYIGPTMSSPGVQIPMVILFWVGIAATVMYYHVDRRLHALVSVVVIGYLYAANHFSLTVQHWLASFFPQMHWLTIVVIYGFSAMLVGYLLLCCLDLMQGKKWKTEGVNIFRRQHSHNDGPEVDEEVIRQIGRTI